MTKSAYFSMIPGIFSPNHQKFLLVMKCLTISFQLLAVVALLWVGDLILYEYIEFPRSVCGMDGTYHH